MQLLLRCIAHRGVFTLSCAIHRSTSARHTSNLPIGVAGVSSHGRIQSKRGIISWGYMSGSGYYVTGVGGKANFVHRVVAYAFLGLPPSGQHYEVNHKDRDRGNNHIDNLEFVTRSENILHSYAANNARKTAADGLTKPVLSRFVGSDGWTAYSSVRQASFELDIQAHRIYRCCQGRASSANGYQFRYGGGDVLPRLPGEEWRPAIHPCTGTQLSAWEVSSHGRVKSARGLVSYGSLTLQGYRAVGVRVNGRSKNFYVHRIVARAFLWKLDHSDQLVVNHRDSDKGNNAVSNLEYVTRSQNILLSHKWLLGRSMATATMSIPIRGRELGSGQWVWYPSMKEAARRTGVRVGGISACCREFTRRRRAGNYEFKLADSTVPSLLPGEVWREIPICLLDKKTCVRLQ